MSTVFTIIYRVLEKYNFKPHMIWNLGAMGANSSTLPLSGEALDRMEPKNQLKI